MEVDSLHRGCFRAVCRGNVGVVAAAAVLWGCASSHGSGAAGSASAPISPAGESIDLVIAATTDVHGRVRGWDYYLNRADSARGLARAATIVDSVRAANPGRVILVDGGDLLQGNPFAYVA